MGGVSGRSPGRGAGGPAEDPGFHSSLYPALAYRTVVRGLTADHTKSLMASHSPLLTTKLYFPAVRRELVPRPRLLARLAEGVTHPLTLIAAPAGFGKTTLVSEWHAS